ncbi:MAG: phosphate acyltransferase PlsX [Clostridiales bacterium]|nr:phosphate acyltransferase PlsX [Clostridiales bacterium]
MIKVALDAMGGDNAPAEIIEGAVTAVRERKDILVMVVGREDEVNAELKKHTYPKEQIQVVPASEVIATSEHPVKAIREKKDSSMVVGLKLVKNGEADAFVSAGNSGAILAGGQIIIGRIKGVERPPFGALIPTEQGVSLLLDCGASVDPRPSMLVQFSQMGSIYMEHVIGIEKPSVGIVNIGAEEEKGNALVQETFPLLKACRNIRFVGSVEARDIPKGGTDVVVCDAFTGNVVLKMYEGTAAMLYSVMKKGLMSSLRSKLGAVLILPALKKTLKDFDASRYGGAPMLGLKGLVVKTHGSAKRTEIHNSILQCLTFKEQKINEKIKECLEAEEQENQE